MGCLTRTRVGKCFTKYGGLPWHSRCDHEFGLRLALSTLATHAARHHKYVTPLVCSTWTLGFDSKVRCSDKPATLSVLDEALVFTCGSCGSFFNPLGTNKNGVKPAH